MTELYTVQRYLQYNRLQELGMTHFDCWASRFGETTTALELAPEGTGYRLRTRFSKFFNLPELMNLFKEVADIKTADQLHLPTPEVVYHTISSKPTEIQKKMVAQLSERAAKVHRGVIDPHVDNMLRITSDGRKLGLDQRIINPILPDEPETKVNRCVENILKLWRDGQDNKLTQLVFSDISTPQIARPKQSSLLPDDTAARSLEMQTQDRPETGFTIYDDIKKKLIASGMPAEQIAFIHDAKTDIQKKELFAKVRSGNVRVLIGSTQKMGAGTNVQDRLIALHDLDCPWRPRDLIQRKGRIERRGNQNPVVHVFRYVTEGTFDAYLWQTIENKQSFISQVMTSKSPVRSCEDIDEAALSYAEIKALCVGDPRIKERMELDMDVSKLRIMKASHQSQQFRMQDRLLKYFPEKIQQTQGFIQGVEADMQTLAEHAVPAEGEKKFAGMEIKGVFYADKDKAAEALFDACKTAMSSEPVEIGSYRGFSMSVSLEGFSQNLILTLKGEMTHEAELSDNPLGNLTRIENALNRMPERLNLLHDQLDNLQQQQKATQLEAEKPFPQEEQLQEKIARLAELDVALNISSPPPCEEQTQQKRVSVLEQLKRPGSSCTKDENVKTKHRKLER